MAKVAGAEDRAETPPPAAATAAPGGCARGYMEHGRRSRAETGARPRQRLPNDYLSYTHNFAAISGRMRGCPALQAKRLGAYWTTAIGTNRSSSSSLIRTCRGRSAVPNVDVWRQIIQEVQPKLVITTGTSGGIGEKLEVGDVIVSPIVRFDCTAKLKSKAFAQAQSPVPEDDTLPNSAILCSR